ncbi:hypothetical protein E1301_Tti005098 [Triplophysa tibetana]|uniref:Uncharacterized protein n=1 Tax=Triplophysa tibetana TaxID=1572043 RepID=A0A5A9NVZ3_9TELE|nr:hypothetical protein E1301_Tti005098 [Triplophysa tibetana]
MKQIILRDPVMETRLMILVEQPYTWICYIRSFVNFKSGCSFTDLVYSADLLERTHYGANLNGTDIEIRHNSVYQQLFQNWFGQEMRLLGSAGAIRGHRHVFLRDAV